MDYCLELLGLDYVDLMLIHNPAAELQEYRASGAAHFFELFHNPTDVTQPDYTGAERAAFLEARRQLAWAAKTDGEKEKKGRADTWNALEDAHAAGKCKYIGVSNYSPALLVEMESYATTCMPVSEQGGGGGGEREMWPGPLSKHVHLHVAIRPPPF
eukprot:SAG22_NODE_190_length_15715_cov_21.164980_10_plen_157_part_00